jgi:hypothetical protein
MGKGKADSFDKREGGKSSTHLLNFHTSYRNLRFMTKSISRGFTR